MPANGETATIPTPTVIEAAVDSGILKEEADLFHQRELDVREHVLRTPQKNAFEIILQELISPLLNKLTTGVGCEASAAAARRPDGEERRLHGHQDGQGRLR